MSDTVQDKEDQPPVVARSFHWRSRYFAAACALLLFALIIFVLPFRRVKTGWPEELTSGSAAGFNLLVITLDTTRADRLGCYGYAAAETPTLDSLAKEGIRFDDAVTVVPVTLPSHATIFTGLYPPNHGVRNNGEFRLHDEHRTLAEVLRDKGYDTAAFVSAFVLDARFGLGHGFDLYDDNVGPATAATAAAFVKPIYERSAGEVTRVAMRWLRGRDGETPFFCWVHYFDPHHPYNPPPPFAGRFPGRPYDGEIAYMDAQIGRLLNTLKTSGLWEHTLIVVAADHGEGLGDHGEDSHAKLIYESTMRVPLLLACPGLFRGPGVIDDAVVSIADIFPTVLELLSVKDDKSRDGLSLVSASFDADRAVYLETLAPYFDNGWSPLYGLRRHHDKYILAPEPEYYDLASDPHELNNLYDKLTGARLVARDALVDELADQLADWPVLQTVAGTARRLDPEALRKLESLGYVGSIPDADTSRELPDPKDMMPVLRSIDHADGLAALGRYEEALSVIRKAAVLSPRDPKALLTMGKIYLHMNRLEEAEDAFRRSNTIRPSARVCILLAQIMLAGGRLGEAETMLDQAESLDPHHGGIYLARGDLFALRGLPEDAFASYRHARDVDPYRAAAEAQARIARLKEIMQMVSPP